jgi:hypothetical protein
MGVMTDYVVETWPPEPLVTERLVLHDQPVSGSTPTS